jgi:hypothetical protein
VRILKYSLAHKDPEQASDEGREWYDRNV